MRYCRGPLLSDAVYGGLQVRRTPVPSILSRRLFAHSAWPFVISTEKQSPFRQSVSVRFGLQSAASVLAAAAPAVVPVPGSATHAHAVRASVVRRAGVAVVARIPCVGRSGLAASAGARIVARAGVAVIARPAVVRVHAATGHRRIAGVVRARVAV